jgi:hypothetical protein
MRDRDRNYRKRSFDDVLKGAGIKVQQTTFRSADAGPGYSGGADIFCRQFTRGGIRSLKGKCGES